MNYEIIYSNLITSRLNRIPETNQYYEKHHIWPKSLGGSNDKSNLVKLTAREHFIAHWLLYKVCYGSDKIKMGHGWFKMCLSKNYKVSSKNYEIAKKAKIYSMKNREILPETRKKLSDNMIGQNNPMFGKKGKDCPNYGRKMSTKTKKKLSKSLKIRYKNFEHPKSMLNKKHSEETKRKIGNAVKKTFQNNPEIIEKLRKSSLGRKHTEESKKKMSLSQSGMKHWKSKKYIVKFLNGKTYLVLNGYKKFCKEFNLTQYGFQKCLKNNIPFKNIEFVKYYKDEDIFDHVW